MTSQMQYIYPCVLTPEDEGGFFVSFPDVPEALTGGDDRAEALEMAEDALGAALGMYVEAREDIPVPSGGTRTSLACNLLQSSAGEPASNGSIRFMVSSLHARLKSAEVFRYGMEADTASDK